MLIKINKFGACKSTIESSSKICSSQTVKLLLFPKAENSQLHQAMSKISMGDLNQRPKRNHNNFLVKIRLKMNSAPSNDSECKFSANADKVGIRSPMGGVERTQKWTQHLFGVKITSK